ncbi:hypothetical protein DFH07DRAFT_771062 [Mycena maculata]|uniref:Uncharacterized protein n=1 Tax=Mycena maculata TaxID=230809 RepID=A0AAD7NJG8_9AGAR|nr:hypothetical protein DFH07DRAFT_771062 [Mycena maculata]
MPRFGGPPERSEGGEGHRMVGTLGAHSEMPIIVNCRSSIAGITSARLDRLWRNSFALADESDSGSGVVDTSPSSSPPPRTADSPNPPPKRPVLPGMENGYALSPMGKLRIQYNQDTEENSALRNRINLIVSKWDLTAKDIFDRGNSSSGAFSRFALETGFRMRVNGLISEFQRLLVSAANLIPERKEAGRHFKLDPQGTLMEILGGAESLDEMTLAWKALRTRFTLAQDYLEKYHIEYQAVTDAELLQSPVSTDVALYEGLEQLAQSSSMNVPKLTYLFENIPHHRRTMERDWDPNTWISTWAPTTDTLKLAFPDREAEGRPSTVYYSTTGERLERELPEGTSWRAGESFTPPEEETKKRSRKRVSIAVASGETSDQALSWERDTTRTHPKFDSNSSASEEGKGKGEPASAYSRIGSHTPFKKDIFPVATDILPRMASSSTRFQTSEESISQALRNPKGPLMEPGWSGNPGIPVQRNIYAEVGPPTMIFNPQLKRDTPPHLMDTERRTSENKEEISRNDSLQSMSERSEREPRGDNLGGTFHPMGNPNPDPGGDPSDSGDDEGGGRRGPDPPRRPPPPPPRRGNRHPGQSGEPGDPNGGSGGPNSGGGGSGRPPPGGGQDPPDPENGGQSSKGPKPPYGTVVPTIDPKLKIASLPEWDGDHSTAIEYFFEIGQLANLEGWLPEALGFWLPSRLKKGSAIYLWFSIQSSRKQSKMRSHYLEYLNMVKDEYLGRKWQILMNLEFQKQSFRQNGHTDESPQQFIGRRIQYARLLAEGDDGGPMEVFLVMRNAPLKWSTILVLENIYSTSQLYSKISEHEDTLVEAARKDQADIITSQNLVSALRKAGVNMDRPKNSSWNRRLNLTEVEDEAGEEPPIEKLPEEGPSEEETDEGVVVLKQVYNTFKKRQRPPPKGGCPYPKHDEVTTRMGRKPPLPCKVCGSANHWDKECPDWNVYLEKQRRGVLIVSNSAVDNELELIDHSAYHSASPGSERLESPIPAESKANLEKIENGDNNQVQVNRIHVKNNGNSGMKVPEDRPSDSIRRSVKKVHMEEIEDEYWANEARMPKARFWTLEDEEDWKTYEEFDDTKDMQTWEESAPVEPLAPGPCERIVLRKKRNFKAGDSALGVLSYLFEDG